MGLKVPWQIWLIGLAIVGVILGFLLYGKQLKAWFGSLNPFGVKGIEVLRDPGEIFKAINPVAKYAEPTIEYLRANPTASSAATVIASPAVAVVQAVSGLLKPHTSAADQAIADIKAKEEAGTLMTTSQTTIRPADIPSQIAIAKDAGLDARILRQERRQFE